MTVLAMHPADILPIALVILVWVGLHRLRRKSRKPNDRDRPSRPH